MDVDVSKRGALWNACARGDAEAVKSVIAELRVEGILVNQCVDRTGTGAAHLAAQYGHTECLQLLLDAGADPDKRRNDGFTPLCSACNGGHKECAEVLIRAGASLETAAGTCAPLVGAARGGHVACVVLLLEAGASDERPYEGKSALEWAQERGHMEVGRLLDAAASRKRDRPAAAAEALLPTKRAALPPLVVKATHADDTRRLSLLPSVGLETVLAPQLAELFFADPRLAPGASRPPQQP